MSTGFKYKTTDLSNIFATGTTMTMTGYKTSTANREFLGLYANIAASGITNYKYLTNNILVSACPKFFSYTSWPAAHTCHSNATGVYLILIGGGGGGGSGGSNDTYSADGGGGGGGGGMLAIRINKSNNPTISTPITITCTNFGAKGGGGAKLTSNTTGNSGGRAGNTTVSIGVISGATAITCNAIGGKGGTGGSTDGSDQTNTPGGAGGLCVTSPAEANYSNDKSVYGTNGGGGTDGTGNDNDKSAGGAGGKSGNDNGGPTFSFITANTYGNGGAGGQGDQAGTTNDVMRFGEKGYDGQDGIIYIFEYFD
jgi:hypothetical protein